MKILHLNVKKKYFDQIKAGTKTEEYREYKKYWQKRLFDKEFDYIIFKNGYQKNAPVIKKKYLETKIALIRHEHFDNKPKTVFIIRFE